MLTETAAPTQLPRDIRSSEGKLVYLYLATKGGATLEELENALAMKKLALYSILETLQDRGLVDKEADEYVLEA